MWCWEFIFGFCVSLLNLMVARLTRARLEKPICEIYVRYISYQRRGLWLFDIRLVIAALIDMNNLSCVLMIALHDQQKSPD